jgi:hypothetical protein
MYLTQLGNLLIDTIETTMEDNKIEVTAEVKPLDPEIKQEIVPCDLTDKACTRRWVDAYSDCA